MEMEDGSPLSISGKPSMKKIAPWFVLSISLAAWAPAGHAAEPGWADLFNGRDLAGWDANPGWMVEDGDIVRVGPGGNLFTVEEFGILIGSETRDIRCVDNRIEGFAVPISDLHKG